MRASDRGLRQTHAALRHHGSTRFRLLSIATQQTLHVPARTPVPQIVWQLAFALRWRRLGSPRPARGTQASASAITAEQVRAVTNSPKAAQKRTAGRWPARLTPTAPAVGAERSDA